MTHPSLVYIVETVKNSNYGYRYSKKLKGLYLKRISDTCYPAHYGRIESLNPDGSIKEETKEQDDVFILSDRMLHPGITIPEVLTSKIGLFNCYDYRTHETDNKHIIGLKGEVDRWHLHRINTDLDNIRSFLITLRGSFKVTGFEPGPDCPDQIADLYKKVDWNTQTLWPEDYSRTLEKDYAHNRTE